MSIPTVSPVDVVYPESDGEPMADNTQQARWIVVLYDNFNAQYRDRDDVFVAADLMWYPVEDHPEIKEAPDVFVAFGRPKGDRRSYQQWREGHVPPTAVFEIRSPKNSDGDMDAKLAFNDEHQVEEYYVYDPDTNDLQGYLRQGGSLRRLPSFDGFVSPRLGIRFDWSKHGLTIYRPDGQPFLLFEELEALRQQAEQERDQAQRERDQAQRERDQAQRERDQTQQRAARLIELSRRARRGQATPVELQELEQLEG